MTREEFEQLLFDKGYELDRSQDLRGKSHRTYWREDPGLNFRLVRTVGDKFASAGSLSFQFHDMKRSTVVMLVDAIVNGVFPLPTIEPGMWVGKEGWITGYVDRIVGESMVCWHYGNREWNVGRRWELEGWEQVDPPDNADELYELLRIDAP